ncbi:ATP-binding protein [Paenibacillus cremeus]|uniref:histidine kinase n=1 Tax=Paenibacillus cremeus TaxID=2163881 RepID=A0A559K4M3_9BACL|nr:ATP-binding protein [Paenibacillus cremeus]TVY07095.1 two-component sensor histidine kinase [Paenibacillus cremeus]
MLVFNYTVEELLLNVFFVMFPLFFYQFLMNEKMEERVVLKNVLSSVLFGASMVLCMTFPITQQDTYRFDFRMIPFLLSICYSTRLISLLLFVVLIGTRFMISGGDGNYLNLISTTTAMIIMFLVEKKYNRLSLTQKVIVLSMITFLSKMMAALCKLFFDPSYFINDVIVFNFLQAVFMGMTVYIIESIRKNVQLRKELIDSEKMKVVSVISASVAHEIRNPLTTVRGFIQLLTQSEVAPEKKQQYGQLCLEELDRAQQIINDYLALAKPQPENIDKLDISEEISYVSKVLTSYANLNGVEIIVQFEPGLEISGDRSKFRQSLINLVKNGIEAMIGRGGVLEITARKQKRSVVLSIHDSGNGMTHEQISRLGTPYFSNKEKGTGLGTMVSFNIIKSMMGSINITSEVGKGTVCQIVFPQQL